MSKVGYKSPPEHSRFKKGQSGNPRGRPKKDYEKGIFGILEDEITIRLSGKNKRVSKIEALVYKLINDALGGDLNALKMLFRIPGIERYFKIKEVEVLPPVTFIVQGVNPGEIVE